MADVGNIDAPSGFSPLRMLDGSPCNLATRRCSIATAYSAALGVGSPVILGGGADADGVPTIEVAATGEAVFGVITSFEPDHSDLTLNYHPASTGFPMYANVCPVHSVVFSCQENSSAAALAAADVGLNVSFTAESVNTTNGRSSVELDCDTEATTNTLALQILSLVRRPDNAIGDNADWEVRFNDIQMANQIAGIS